MDGGIKVLLFYQGGDVILYGQSVTFFPKVRFQSLDVFPLELSRLIPWEIQPFEPDASRTSKFYLLLCLDS